MAPIYEFKCDDCGYCFEVITYHSDKSDEYCCVKCLSKNLGKAITAPATYTIEGNNSASCSPKAHNNKF